MYLIACARRRGDELPGVCRVMLGLADRVYSSRLPDRPLRQQVYPHAEELFNSRGEVDRMREIGEALVKARLATADEVQVAGTACAALLPSLSLLAYGPFAPLVPEFKLIAVELHSAHLVREVFGDLPPQAPAPPPFESGWRTERVSELARECVGNLLLLPRLAEELQRAGCTRRDVLRHLREPTPHHVRECWALQLVLGNGDEPPR